MLILKNKNIHTLVIFITKRCNLRCSYCYVNQNDIDINTEILERSLDFFLHCYGNVKKVILMGGEPLLRTDLIEKTINLLHFLKRKFPYKKIVITITTNGTVLNDRILRVLKFVDYVAISLDGQELTHNLHRIYHNGKGSFNKVLNNVKKIKRIYPKKLVINKIITCETAQHLFQDTLFLLSLKPMLISLNIALGDLGWDENKVNILFNEAERLYLWIKKNWKDTYIRHTCKLLFKPILHECPMTHLSIDPEGNIYPCEILLNRKQDCIGNIILGWLKADIIDCKFSVNNEKCVKELCRRCDQICKKIYFNSWHKHPYSDGIRWIEKALDFQTFFLKQYEKDMGKFFSSKENEYMLRSSLKIL